MKEYIVEPVVMDKNHPFWPKAKLYRTVHVETGRESLGMYTTKERAQEWADKKNSGC